MDNGDIVCMGTIFKPGKITNIWLLKVNAQGCLGDESCETIVITDTDDINAPLSVDNIILHPNPSTGQYYFDKELVPLLEQIIITDMAGTRIKTIKTITSDYLDLSAQGSGIYHVLMVMKDGTLKSGKVMKVE